MRFTSNPTGRFAGRFAWPPLDLHGVGRFVLGPHRVQVEFVLELLLEFALLLAPSKNRHFFRLLRGGMLAHELENVGKRGDFLDAERGNVLRRVEEDLDVPIQQRPLEEIAQRRRQQRVSAQNRGSAQRVDEAKQPAPRQNPREPRRLQPHSRGQQPQHRYAEPRFPDPTAAQHRGNRGTALGREPLEQRFEEPPRGERAAQPGLVEREKGGEELDGEEAGVEREIGALDESALHRGEVVGVELPQAQAVVELRR